MRKPPVLTGRTDPVFDLLMKSPHKEHLPDYLALLKPLDDQGRYLPFDEWRYRWAPGLDSRLCWTLVKKARTAQYSCLLPLGAPVQWGFRKNANSGFTTASQPNAGFASCYNNCVAADIA